jgi:hypothetical protein
MAAAIAFRPRADEAALAQRTTHAPASATVKAGSKTVKLFFECALLGWFAELFPRSWPRVELAVKGIGSPEKPIIIPRA